MAHNDRINQIIIARGGVFHRAQDLAIVKLAEYGTSRFDDHPEDFNLWMCYSDLWRKCIRMLQQVRNADVDGLIESFMDALNYCANAIVIIEQMKEKK